MSAATLILKDKSPGIGDGEEALSDGPESVFHAHEERSVLRTNARSEWERDCLAEKSMHGLFQGLCEEIGMDEDSGAPNGGRM